MSFRAIVKLQSSAEVYDYLRACLAVSLERFAPFMENLGLDPVFRESPSELRRLASSRLLEADQFVHDLGPLYSTTEQRTEACRAWLADMFDGVEAAYGRDPSLALNRWMARDFADTDEYILWSAWYDVWRQIARHAESGTLPIPLPFGPLVNDGIVRLCTERCSRTRWERDEKKLYSLLDRAPSTDELALMEGCFAIESPRSAMESCRDMLWLARNNQYSYEVWQAIAESDQDLLVHWGQQLAVKTGNPVFPKDLRKPTSPPSRPVR
jgi:hypothetical protein